ncbi:MAG: hypothetical protein H6822_23405 [Planctomycetaceae bacterium]|nr:hypothetical protein [Planctomycetales bacterium]MCB9925146.1 hypothetical protein [Planctomycetaceae bacterium]
MSRHTSLSFALTIALVMIACAVDGDDIETGGGVVTTPVAERQGVNPEELDGAGRQTERLREGMRYVNKIGELREAGGSIAFYPDGESHSLQLLENLALERVAQDLDQSHRKWSVTGIITEYKGGNFLLLQRAVLKARVSTSSGPRS